MQFRFKINLVWLFFMICGCTTAQSPYGDIEITRAEAKTYACPKYILDAGASVEDCQCVESELFQLGKNGRALAVHQEIMYEAFEGIANEREDAIASVRIMAFESCGLLDEGHIVERNL